MLLVQSFLLLLTCAAAVVEASVAGFRPHDSRHTEATIKARQNANAAYAITGAQTGQALPRLEIRDLQSNYPDQFNILILAWRSMQAMDQSDFLSYFRIAGIHGVPTSAWNGVQGQGNGNPGYCAHASNIFLPWHRPYLALFEQILVQRAQAVASEFASGAQRDRYLNAAASLRLPYWDWAMDPPAGQHNLPDSIGQPTIQVITPNGTETIPNPLYQYTFHPIDRGLMYRPYTQWPNTLRWPTSTNSNARTQVSVLQEQMDTAQASVKLRLYTLLTSSANFTQFGNSAWIPRAGAGSYDSLESVHDEIHGTIGGMNNGNMGAVPVSAFDPSFWFHHCMIDRLFAIWQALYPNSYLEPQAQLMGTYWFNKGDVLDASTALKPFYADPNGNFWTPNSCRDTRTLGYIYPEIASGQQSDVIAAVNRLYGSNAPGQPSKSKARRKRSPQVAGGSGTSSSVSGANGTSPEPAQYLYQINFRAPKNAVDSSWFIDFFIGNGPQSEDPNTWLSDPNRIGSHPVIAMQNPQMPQVTITGVVMMNTFLQKLVAQGRLANMEQATVLAMLQDQIAWRIKTTDGQAVPAATLTEFKVAVSTILVLPAGSQNTFPTYVGDWQVHQGVTQGKSGGLHFGDPI